MILSNLTKNRQIIVGLDLSDRSIKVIGLKKKNQQAVLSFHQRNEIVEKVIEHGQIKDKMKLTEIVKSKISHLVRHQECVISLPETESFIKIIRLPKMKKSEIKKSIKWEAEANIPLSIDEVYFDWQVIHPPFLSLDEQNKYTDVLIGALPKKLVDDYLSVFKEAQIKPIAFEIESVATSRALIKKSFSPEPIMIIDLGASRTSFIIFAGNTLHFTTSTFDISNEKIVDEIKTTLKISHADARQIKIKYGLRKNPANQAYSIIASSIQKVIQSAQKYIDFFANKSLDGYVHQKKIKKIILTGGGSLLLDLDRFISRQLKIEVEIGNPWINFSHPPIKNNLSYPKSMSYTTAIGLALRNFTNYDQS